MAVKVQEGKYYRRRDGLVVGPAKYDPTNVDFSAWEIGGQLYDHNGRHFLHDNNKEFARMSLAEEVDDSANGDGPPTRPSPMHELLDKAKETVSARGQPYGGVEDNFERIARLWHAHLANRYGAGPALDAHDVAMMMVLMKVARLANSPDHPDSWIDIAGYAACGGSLKPVDSMT